MAEGSYRSKQASDTVNHHPGNEWYRRLIKSNRPLYRACPKHTKLLVSKAIVQAVEQQGGRFLEKDRTDGFWYECTYKRSVDKTSQGLRERDREDGDGGGSVGTDELPAVLAGKSPYPHDDDDMVELPEAFSGKNRQTPKLSDLADAALAQAHKMDGLPRSASQLVGYGSNGGPALPGRSAVSFKRQPPSNISHNNSTKPKSAFASSSTSKKRSLEDDDPIAEQQQQRQQQQQKQKQKQTSLPSAKRMKEQQQPPSSGGRKDEEDFAPLPPSLEQRESSMFRLLKHTKLLLQGSETWAKGGNAGADPPSPPIAAAAAAAAVKQEEPVVKKQPQYEKEPPPSRYAESMHQQQHPQYQQQHHHARQPQQQENDRMIYQQVLAGQMMLQEELQHQQQQMPPSAAAAARSSNREEQQEDDARRGRGGGDNAPSLTRLTTEVSDWLTSFWPVPTRGQSVAIIAPGGRPPQPPPPGYGEQHPAAAQQQQQPQGMQAMQQQAANHGYLGVSIMPPSAPSEREMARHSFQQNVASKIVNVPPPRYELPVKINQIPPMKKQQEQQHQQPPPTPIVASKRSKRKSASTLPELPHDGLPQTYDSTATARGDSEQPPTNVIDDLAAAAPTELEQSVSATLLKLAVSPSRLFSGLSSFFEGPPPPQINNHAGETSESLPSVGGTRRTSGSLLDDYEDTPLEHKMRVGARRTSGSLLDDDDDETPMIEQRMRAPFVRH